jgi:hypothetical protein
VTIGDDVAAALPEMRRQADSLMTESLRFGLWSEVPDDNLETLRTLTDVRYAGKGQIKYPTSTVFAGDSNGQQFGVQDIIAKIPFDAQANIPEGYTCIVDASNRDPLLVGHEFRVKGSPQAGAVTSHRYPLEEA